MIALFLRNDKTLILTQNEQLYEGENNFTILNIISAPAVQDYELTNFVCELHVINAKNEGDIVRLDFVQDEESGKLKSAVKLPVSYLYAEGIISFFIKIIGTDGEIGKTNIVRAKVNKHTDFDDYIGEPQLTLLDQYSLAFNNKLEEVKDVAKKIADGEFTPDFTIDSFEYTDGETAEIVNVGTKSQVKLKIRLPKCTTSSADDAVMMDIIEAVTNNTAEIDKLKAEKITADKITDGAVTESKLSADLTQKINSIGDINTALTQLNAIADSYINDY